MDDLGLNNPKSLEKKLITPECYLGLMFAFLIGLVKLANYFIGFFLLEICNLILSFFCMNILKFL